MSMYKDKQIEAEETRRLLFREHRELRKTYEAEERERLKRQMQAYKAALIECGLV